MTNPSSESTPPSDDTPLFPTPIGETPPTIVPIVILPADIPKHIARITAGEWHGLDKGMDRRELIISALTDKAGGQQAAWLVRNGTPWRGSILVRLNAHSQAVRCDRTSGVLSRAHTAVLQQFVAAQLDAHRSEGGR